MKKGTSSIEHVPFFHTFEKRYKVLIQVMEYNTICKELVSMLDISRHPLAFKQFAAGTQLHRIHPEKSLIIMQLSGKILNVGNASKVRYVCSYMIYLLPKFATVFGRVEEDSCVMLCRIPDGFDRADRPYLMNLSEELPDGFEYEFNTLPAIPLMKDFVRLLAKAVMSGLDSREYLRVKRREFFYYLKSCFDRKDVAAFMYPLIGGKSVSFKDFVISNYMNFDDVGTFAESANMSVSTFSRHFKDSFGVSAYRWMDDRKAENIFKDIVCSEMTFTEISDKYRFSSSAYLVAFCRRHFGKQPSDIRKEYSGGGTSISDCLPARCLGHLSSKG